MKKLKWLAPILIVSLLFEMVACKQPIEPHRHVFTKEWTSDSTYHWHAATCGHDLIIDKTEHVWDSGTLIKEPNLTNSGLVTYSCSVCDKKKDNELSAYLTELPLGTDGTLGTDGKYVLFGKWPQTIKESNVIIDENNFRVQGGYTYYKGSDGAWYAKILEKGYSNNYIYSDGSAVAKRNNENPNYLYFKVEPIKWRVVSTNYEGKKLLVAENILTADISFYPNVYAGERSIDGKTIYPNNYLNSRVRAYLNGIEYKEGTNNKGWIISSKYKNTGFLQTAFSESEQVFIELTSVDNSLNSTKISGTNEGANNIVICSNTDDKIFLLSVNEVTSELYGFTTDTSSSVVNARSWTVTDFSKATGAYVLNDFYGYTWLRSPSSFCAGDYDYTHVNATCGGGISSASSANSSSVGIVPVLTLSY